jgi:hypothetical protein
VIRRGAVMAFQSEHNMTINGDVNGGAKRACPFLIYGTLASGPAPLPFPPH